jgi:LPXTG-site transpeptidase (sortase) family protein
MCILIGILSLFYGGYLFWQRTNPARLSFEKTPHFPQFPKTTTVPVRISIDRVHINLSLYPARVQNNLWDTTSYGASFLSSTPIPGEKGNSIIYAHNWTNLFGGLTEVKPADMVTIYYKNNTKKTFTVLYTDIVTPRDIQILNPSTDRRITLYTCTGFLDMKRFVAVAILR